MKKLTGDNMPNLPNLVKNTKTLIRTRLLLDKIGLKRVRFSLKELKAIRGMFMIWIFLSPVFCLAQENHFFNKEFACKCCGVVHINKNLIPLLEKLRHELGDKPILINSAYRCPKHNKEVGGVKNSQHCLGCAVDIRIKGVSSSKVCKVAKRIGFTWVKDYGTFSHIDIRKVLK